MTRYLIGPRHGIDRAWRRGLSVLLAATLLTSALAVSVPAGASDHAHQRLQATTQSDDPAARLQIILRTIHVVNDRDGSFRGAGDFTLTANFWRCSGPEPPCSPGNHQGLVAEWTRDFSEDSGDARTFDRLMPVAPDVRDGLLASEDGGLVVHAGQRYMFQVSMFERDTSIGDYMGGIQQVIDESSGWGIGLHELEPAGKLEDTSIVNSSTCAGCGGVIVGDYLVTYEIIRAALPDLRPTAIRLLGDAGDGLEEVCLAIENVGQETAGPFNMTLSVDGNPALNGSVNLVGLGAGAPHESCIRTALPTSGLHTLDLVVDQARAVPEVNERNNQLQQSLDRGPAAATPTPIGNPESTSQRPGPSGSPTPGPIPVTGRQTAPSQADLTVGAIMFNGQAPDGKNDCKDGKNDVTVLVKNGGAAKTGGFVVRLLMDGGQVDEQSVNWLDAGQEREVRFGDVRLKQGVHTVAALADAKEKVAEADEANNELEVTARCVGDD